MPNFEETVIKNFSGLSTETKPTIAAGNAIPNGSRWREVDTFKTYHFNLADDCWYEAEAYASAIKAARSVVDLRALDVLEQMLVSLKKIEYHLKTATDTELNDQDV